MKREIRKILSFKACTLKLLIINCFLAVIIIVGSAQIKKIQLLIGEGDRPYPLS